MLRTLLKAGNHDEVESNKTLEKRVIINVGGMKHETFVSTLERLPGTRLAVLAHLLEADENYDVM